MNNKIELKPCPFCGGKAEIVSMSEKFTVSCASGGCMANIAWCPDEEKAAQAWNARTLGWIPCSERMPEKDTSVLISAQGHRVSAFYDSVKGVFMLTETEGLIYSMSAVTHWMPLPQPPKGEPK